MLELLGAYAWPGNTRELENSLERALILAPGERLSPELFPGPARRLDIATLWRTLGTDFPLVDSGGAALGGVETDLELRLDRSAPTDRQNGDEKDASQGNPSPWTL